MEEQFMLDVFYTPEILPKPDEVEGTSIQHIRYAALIVPLQDINIVYKVVHCTQLHSGH